MSLLNKARPHRLLPLSAALLLAACGGGGGSDTGSLTVGVTDAPVDGADAVVVAFTNVVLHKADGTTVEFPYDGPDIDLLQFQDPEGEPRALLVNDQSLEAGEYNWIRLDVTDGSYITINQQQYDLRVPSGELKLNRPFVIPQGGVLDVTLDFDLRKSVTKPAGDYILRPTVRVVNTNSSGDLSGVVSGTYLSDTCGGYTAGKVAVYIYAEDGGPVTPGEMGDTTNPEPLVTTWVNDDAGTYRYHVSYLEAGDYTVALTCNGDDDLADTEEGTIDFVDVAASVPVTAGDIASQDFPVNP